MKTLKETIEMELKAVNVAIKQIQEKIDIWEPDIDDYEDQYCEMLDECNEINIGSLTYSASRVLSMVDPTAYRCGLVDYVDSLSLEPEDLEEELEELNDRLDELEEAIDEFN